MEDTEEPELADDCCIWVISKAILSMQSSIRRHAPSSRRALAARFAICNYCALARKGSWMMDVVANKEDKGCDEWMN
jgi:hypothetical protein